MALAVCAEAVGRDQHVPEVWETLFSGTVAQHIHFGMHAPRSRRFRSATAHTTQPHCAQNTQIMYLAAVPSCRQEILQWVLEALYKDNTLTPEEKDLLAANLAHGRFGSCGVMVPTLGVPSFACLLV